MKKKKISKLILKICCVALLTTVLISAIVVPSFAWEWTNSVPYTTFGTGTNSYALFPLISGTYSYIDNNATTKKTITYNAPYEVSFEYGNGFTPGYSLGRELKIYDNKIGYVGALDYRSKAYSLSDELFLDVGSNSVSEYLRDTYYPYTNQILTQYDSGPCTRIDYQIYGYQYQTQSTASITGLSDFSFQFGNAYLNYNMLEHTAPMIAKIFVPKSNIIDIQEGKFNRCGINLSFNYMYYNEVDNNWVTKDKEIPIYVFHSNPYVYYEEDSITVAIGNGHQALNGMSAYVDVGKYIAEDMRNSLSQDSLYLAQSDVADYIQHYICINNLTVEPLNISSTTLDTGITAVEIYNMSYRPYERVEQSWPADGFFDVACANAFSGFSGPDNIDFLTDLTGTMSNSIGNVFNTEILPGISLGLICTLPFMFILLLYILKVFAGG